jgi:hypothetical protein
MRPFFDIIPKFEKDLQQKEPNTSIHMGTRHMPISGSGKSDGLLEPSEILEWLKGCRRPIKAMPT